jgi:glycosyltransferase involved in cell wall biosynthesis
MTRTALCINVDPNMSWQNTCLAVLPCRNEATAIGDLIVEIHRHLPNVLVVDDGSTDATARIARDSGAQLLQLNDAQGKGAALQQAWTWARTEGFIWILTIDGDGQHSPSDIPTFFDKQKQTGAALIIGNRMDNTECMPLIRRWVNRWMSCRLSHLTDLTLPDSQCGYRLIQIDSFDVPPSETNHFEWESEVIVAFARKKLPIEFVAIQTLYGPEQSKIRPITDAMRWLKWWWKSRSSD